MVFECGVAKHPACEHHAGKPSLIPHDRAPINDLLLHHYPASPFSEKVRAVLGYKKLPWQSVHIPVIMPKPDLVALTGGYRKTPVLQLGRDVYCDTRLIIEVLERLHPSPAVIPDEWAASCLAHAQQADQLLFFTVIPVIFQPAGVQALLKHLGPEVMGQFQADRATLFAGGDAQRPTAEFSQAQLPGLLAALESQLVQRPFLLGDKPTLADFATYHPIWFVLGNPGVANTFDAYPKLLAWAGRIRALGHGTSTQIEAEQALTVARTTTAAQLPLGSEVKLDKLTAGSKVSVHATDYGVDEMTGTLVHVTTQELALQRHDSRAGDVIVHVPRAGFSVKAID